jgi:hypothetical protein
VLIPPFSIVWSTSKKNEILMLPQSFAGKKEEDKFLHLSLNLNPNPNPHFKKKWD